MVIDYLADFPEYISIIAPEIAAHWSKIVPEETAASRVAKLKGHLNREIIPIAWVAHSGDVFSRLQFISPKVNKYEEAHEKI